MTQHNNYLAHYGVKGMRWGVRKSRSSSTSKKKGSLINITVNRNIKTPSSKASKVSGKKKSAKEMTDDELRKVINRMNMEKQYKQLTAKELSPGRKFVQDVISNAAKETAKKYVSKGMDKAVDSLLKEAKTEFSKKKKSSGGKS